MEKDSLWNLVSYVILNLRYAREKREKYIKIKKGGNFYQNKRKKRARVSLERKR